ncbi:MAG: hypothetical protein WBW74_22675 [Xanthobacteraceae bacterium]
MTADCMPSAFVWTKIAAEAGQKLDRILNRKELEQKSGGTFWWGVGESKREKIDALVGREAHPTVLFSEMRSNAHARDSRPDAVVLWEEYQTARGNVALPPHVIVTSRARDRHGRPKSFHYALVCQSPARLLSSGGGMLDTGMLRNFGDGGRPLGSSQITAVVERITRAVSGMSYPITARAILVPPYAVRQAGPRVLSDPELQLLDEVSVEGKTSKDWLAVVKHLRRASQSQVLAGDEPFGPPVAFTSIGEDANGTGRLR